MNAANSGGTATLSSQRVSLGLFRFCDREKGNGRNAKRVDGGCESIRKAGNAQFSARFVSASSKAGFMALYMDEWHTACVQFGWYRVFGETRPCESGDFFMQKKEEER